MDGGSPFEGEPEDSREAIMRATFRALQQHGYAGLSIQRIADEAGYSKSTFYHHYDDKEDLLLSFLDFIVEQCREEWTLEADGDAADELRTFLRLAMLGAPPHVADGPERPDPFVATFVELRAQAIHDEEYRDRIAALDRRISDYLASIIRRGIDAGVFREVDPERIAETLLTVVVGGMVRRVTAADAPLDVFEAELDDFLERRLLADGFDG